MRQNLYRHKYDSFVVRLFNLGKEDILPEDFVRSIPTSTRSYWRNELDYGSYCGSEFRDLEEKGLGYAELFQQRRHLERLVLAIVTVWTKLSDILLPVIRKKEAYSERFVEGLQCIMQLVPRKTVLKYAGISASFFHERIARLKVKCDLSPRGDCLKRHPLQLSGKEVKKIKGLFNDPKLACWPVSSLYFEGLRNRGLHIGRSSFYKYARVLGLKRDLRFGRKKKQGVRASCPNEYLHVDTTFWPLAEGTKAAIAFVSDNFSKAILGYSVAVRNAAENVREALRMAVGTIREHHPEQVSSVLLADGGGENHGAPVEELLEEETPPEIRKVIALNGVKFSNSPIEAVNKIAKRYLRYYDPRTLGKLKELIPWIVEDYGDIRPHGSLRGLTPMEVYKEPSKDLDFHKRIQQARAERIEENRKVNCGGCGGEA